MFNDNKLGEVIELTIVSIDKGMKYQKKTFIFKPTEMIDPKASKLHGYDNKYF